MPSIPRRLKQLDKMLADMADKIDPMLISELDGFIAGIVVCPELIMPGEWLPMIWGGGPNEDSNPAFDDIAQAEKLTGLIMEHYNATIADLTAGRYAPVFDVDPRNDDILWEFWIDGFGAAMGLRPGSWMELADADDDTRTALAGFIMLGDISHEESDLPEAEIEELTSIAPDLISLWTETLNAWRLSQSPGQPSQRSDFGKVGRNDPCPCGSGKKYKKCCGLN